MRVNEILQIRNSKLINGNNINISYFSLNTNDIKGKTFFIPLKTDNYNDIINGVRNGLTGFFIEKGYDDIINQAISFNKNIVVIEVDNISKTFWELVKIASSNISVPIIAVSGSYGKTCQLEMIYSVLKEKYCVLYTNLNNNIDSALTLLNYKNEDIILLEFISQSAGEITFLRDLYNPSITVITHIGTTHLDNFKNIKNIIRENTSIINNCKYFFHNTDDYYLKKIEFKNTNVVTYSIFDEDVSNIILDKKITYTYSYKGKRYSIVINDDLEFLVNYSVCAIKIGLLLNLDMGDIIKGIKRFKCPNKMKKINYNNRLIIYDCDNSSYETMISGLKYFDKINKKNKIVILEDILGLGKHSKKIHLNLAKHILENNYSFEEIHLAGNGMKIVFDYLNKHKYKVFYYNNINNIDKNILDSHCAYLKFSNSDYFNLFK